MSVSPALPASAPEVLQYHPLSSQEIRLLTIHAGAQEDHIRTSLHHASFTEALDYEALSYTWSRSIAKDPPVVDPETLIEVGIVAINRANPTNVMPKVERVKWKDLPRHEHSYTYYMIGGPRGNYYIVLLSPMLLLILAQNQSTSPVAALT
jgi:hypothetical protein